MNGWILRGLRGGILTTRYPQEVPSMPSLYRGRVLALEASPEAQNQGASACLTGAIAPGPAIAAIDERRCFQCGECVRRAPEAFAMRNDIEVAQPAKLLPTGCRFGRSIHVRHVDAGSDASCEQELAAIFNPYYDANRLGVFLTASPRRADILLVTGVVAEPMKEPLQRVYAAMPLPKRVVAVGTAACSGGLFAHSACVAGPVDTVLPVDVYLPGAPPPPLAILYAILLAAGRLQPSEVGR